MTDKLCHGKIAFISNIVSIIFNKQKENGNENKIKDMSRRCLEDMGMTHVP